MTTLYIPTWSGDYRLEPTPDGFARLTLEKPTPGEVATVSRFLTDCTKRRFDGRPWVADAPCGKCLADKFETVVRGPYDKVARRLVKAAAPPRGKRLVAVASHDGRVTVSDEYPDESGEYTTAIAVVPKPERTPHTPRDPEHAKRPEACLTAFLTAAQRLDWARSEAFTVRGNESGARYLVAHRDGPLAERYGASLVALDAVPLPNGFRPPNEGPLGTPQGSAFGAGQDCGVWVGWLPPEEECLALGLFASHRERDLVETAFAPYAPDPMLPVAALLGAAVGDVIGRG